ncbi:MAG TPA: enoyl-CoA hydratase-related protein [Candidatus Acidoferrales bacterium]|nr:enoyl-CoA hydratase-related protein [Candidatus Acidoferrales bacterium]
MSSVELEWRDGGHIALLTLNRPQVLNALNTDMARELGEHLEMLEARSDLRCAVLTGAGDRAFCSGADLRERGRMNAAQWLDQHQVLERAMRGIRRLRAPIFSAVNGVALGGGCELAMQTDFILAAQSALFGQPEVRRGIIPGAGGTQNLLRRIPVGSALRMLLSGDPIDAAEALRMGLVASIHPAHELLPAALEVARRIGRNSPFAIRQVKQAIRLGGAVPSEIAYDAELEAYRRTIGHPDQIEGVRAFNEKREPRFQDPG